MRSGIGPGYDAQNTGFFLYPNPAVDRIYLQIPEGGNSSPHLSIRDIAGRLVQELFVGPRTLVELHLPDLIAGLYLVTLADEDSTVTERLLLK